MSESIDEWNDAINCGLADAGITPAIDSSGPANRSRWRWAAYLGVSWTWCIGMFLPVLLIRDYGPWAWVIFALPNIVGAGAMGWVMRSQSMSRAYRVNHGSACRLFSVVTIAFQFFFYFWMIPKLTWGNGVASSIAFVFGAMVLLQLAFTPIAGLRRIGWGTLVTLAVSVAAAIALSTRHVLVWPDSQPISIGDAIGLTLVCLAGFVACPYLDLTFHRARIETSDGDAKFAFGVGFGVVFASMIVFTFFYATNMLGLSGVAGWLLAGHLSVQMAYTINVHSAELKQQAYARDDAGILNAELGVALAIGMVAAVLASSVSPDFTYHGRTLGELGYRTFMSTYGLLFPAYVLLAIGRPRVSTIAWLLITVAATPFYWLAFIEGRMAWAIAGVAVLLIGAIAGRALTPAVPVSPSE